MNEFIIILITIIFAYILGVISILFTGGKTTLQYLQCKIKNTKKIFIWVDTYTGRTSVVGNIEGGIQKGIVSWKFNGEQYLTTITGSNVKRWKAVYYMGVNMESPLVAYDQTKLGEMPLCKVDLKVVQNIISRALTKPSLDDDDIKKYMVLIGVGILVVLGALVIVYFKIDSVLTVVNGLNVI